MLNNEELIIAGTLTIMLIILRTLAIIGGLRLLKEVFYMLIK